jgi:hypothetical protein
MSKQSRFLATLGIVGAFVLGACGEGRNEGEMAEPIGEEETGMPEVPGAEQPAAAAPTEVGLEAKGESNVTGTATVSPVSDGFEISLEVSGLTPGETYAAHLHRGTCDNDQGVVAPLEDVTASDDTGRSTTTIGTSMLDPSAESLFIQVHNPDGTPIACGEVPKDAGLTKMRASIGETGATETGAAEQPTTGTDEYR